MADLVEGKVVPTVPADAAAVPALASVGDVAAGEDPGAVGPAASVARSVARAVAVAEQVLAGEWVPSALPEVRSAAAARPTSDAGALSDRPASVVAGLIGLAAPPAAPRYRGKARLCNARNNTCGANAVSGGVKCYNHGGKSLRGAASPQFKHGRYSKYLPAQLAERYRTAMTDPELLEMRSEIALLDARLAQVLSGLDTDESGAAWAQAREMFASFKADFNTRRMEDAVKQLDGLEKQLAHGSEQAEMWAEIMMLMDARRKIVAEERRRNLDLKQSLTVAEATLLFRSIEGILLTRITDGELLNDIASDLAGIFNRRAS